MNIVLDSNKVGAICEYIKNTEPNSTYIVTSLIFIIYAFDEWEKC